MEYYAHQAGTGLAAYGGIRFQKGHGFFGRIIKGAVPLIRQLLPYLGKKALDTGVSIVSDVYNRKNPKEAIKANLKKTAGNIADDALVRVRTKFRGEGIKRRTTRKRKSRAPKKTTTQRKTTPIRRSRTKRIVTPYLDLW